MASRAPDTSRARRFGGQRRIGGFLPGAASWRMAARYLAWIRKSVTPRSVVAVGHLIGERSRGMAE
jgi:hypothetical protein